MASKGPEEPTPGRNPALVYLDSNFYFDVLISNRAGHKVACAVLDAWKAGLVEVATSALTLTEILYVLKDDPSERQKIDRARDADIIDMFRQYPPRQFRLVELERTIAESARTYVWDHNIRPKDAIHIASAVRSRCPVMFSRDKKLLKASGKLGGSPLLRIVPPAWTEQKNLGLTGF